MNISLDVAKFHSSGLALIDVVDNIFEHLDNCDRGVGICIVYKKPSIQ